MDKAKAYFLKHTELKYVDMFVWGPYTRPDPTAAPAFTHHIQKHFRNALKQERFLNSLFKGFLKVA